MSDLDDIAFRILAAAGHAAASSTRVRPDLPTLDELASLARHHVANSDTSVIAPRGTLAHAGVVCVSTLAARQYQQFEKRVIEDVTDDVSRFAVTKLMLNARAAPMSGDTDLWRVRDRSLGIELVARVIVDERLRIVTSVTATDMITAVRSG